MNDLIQKETRPAGRYRAGQVSVVIPCYNQGRYLCEAIRSILCQTYRNFEIIVVDDGSTDNTRDVATAEPVRYAFQTNQGLSAARNRGIREGNGEFFIFLDADDRLLPDGIRAGVKALSDRPDCAFAYGDYREIDESGNVLQESNRHLQTVTEYRTLLKSNCIEMHATVIYRRNAFEDAGLFDSGLTASEDYDMYLRISRRMPICYFNALIAEYRMHQGNMSRDLVLMLRTVLQVLRSQKEFVRKDQGLAKAYREGLRDFAGMFAVQLARQSCRDLSNGSWIKSLRGFGTLIRHYPFGTAQRAFSFCLRRLSRSETSTEGTQI
jgi:glycosyltransferase involved in cell wall biosynthesis